jgi:hypothetical protein
LARAEAFAVRAAEGKQPLAASQTPGVCLIGSRILRNNTF